MTTLAIDYNPLAYSVRFVDKDLIVDLVDGRSLSVPLSWFPSLSQANQTQLNDWELLGEGEGIHWPQLDEDLSVSGLLAGNRSNK